MLSVLIMCNIPGFTRVLWVELEKH
ncbi:hypothetical protein Goari_002266 [Gossypium aridum]|uniref:Uncharacterized protein n=1 Tax=Gossypium aridum TaxID=34290 RepID=A0A7J8Y7T3_GOSAI|nr:hypothetical protein [Gossypium aridum]